jgi:hypothetical protein
MSAVALVAVAFGGCQEQRTPDLHALSGAEQTRVQTKSDGAHGAALASVAAPDAPKVEQSENDDSTQGAASYGDESNDGESTASDDLTIRRLVITDQVRDREPAPDPKLQVGDRAVIAFVELANDASVDQKIVITFEHEGGQKVGFVNLKIPAKQTRWRTWAQTNNVHQAGKWSAVVSTEGGAVLERAAFEVDPA